jgi:hypothetical protein
LSGTFSGNGAGLTNLNGSDLTAGSVGTTQLAGGALAAPVSVSSTNEAAIPNTRYVVTNASLTTFNLPTNADIGDVVQITGEGAGGWEAELNPSVWTPAEAPSEDWQAVASSSDGTHLFAVVNGGGIYASMNSGAAWTPTAAPSENWQSIACSSDGTHLVAAGAYIGVCISPDSGATWTQPIQPNPDLVLDSVASSSDGTHLVAVAAFTLVAPPLPLPVELKAALPPYHTLATVSGV